MANRFTSFENESPIAMPKPQKSPPLAFQMTSNDALVAPSQPTYPSQSRFSAPDYLNNPSATGKLDPYEVTSPMEQDLQSQVRKQTEALRLQHQAFVVERECWEMERERLYKRIASLEGLLKSPKGHRSVNSPPDSLTDESQGSRRDRNSYMNSPARSPVISPFPNDKATTSHPTPVSHRASNASSSRLPSIAEHDASSREERKVSFIKREAAPKFIDIQPKSVLDSLVDELEVQADLDDEQPPSPPATRQVLSPPPPEYRRDAGHTPLRLPSRPQSSDSTNRGSLLFEALEATPTRRNTARNKSMLSDDEEDICLAGPLRLPELPSKPSSENFTMDALTARLQYIEEHPDESQPLVLSARFNRDDESEVDESDLTIVPPRIEEPPKDTPSLSQGETSAAEMSPPPASESSQAQEDDFQDNGGIRLKKKTSCNFGAPFGQLRM
ncbi:hypothetical protein KVT40_007329 [Elsinoe batatas]|uniref:Uncharacterized protein n=1 Tax=Elsinoe batatas TaxID=2601811 RepID=A0A8K0KVW4_9PEZI|nr:hypothetical protein KVT40_007329 [Elsinoe batatas]